MTGVEKRHILVRIQNKYELFLYAVNKLGEKKFYQTFSPWLWKDVNPLNYK